MSWRLWLKSVKHPPFFNHFQTPQMSSSAYPKRKHLTIIEKNGRTYFKVQFNKTKLGLKVNKTFSKYEDAIELIQACENKYGAVILGFKSLGESKCLCSAHSCCLWLVSEWIVRWCGNQLTSCSHLSVRILVGWHTVPIFWSLGMDDHLNFLLAHFFFLKFASHLLHFAGAWGIAPTRYQI